VRERDEIFKDLLDKELKTMPGLWEVLDLLDSLNIKKAIATSSKKYWLDLILERINLKDRFVVTVSGDEVRRGKPNPEIYLLVCHRLMLRPDECLVLEDTPAGVTSAKEAGMKAVAIPNEYTKELNFPLADKRIDSLLDIDRNFLDRI
jgi:HAD superfamily hydrolase (TIGR01509 family)